MASAQILLASFLLLLLSFSSCAFSRSIIDIYPAKYGGGDRTTTEDNSAWCESWKLSVEANDAGYWESIPSCCVSYVEEYMTGGRYLSDSVAVAASSLKFAARVNISSDGKDVWVFDVDETLLSNLPYYESVGIGSTFNETSFDEWVDLAEAPALPASFELYRDVSDLGFTIVLLTGRSESQRTATAANLLKVGYANWERLLLRESSDQGTTAVAYKSKKRAELVSEGYRIRGNSGDQWSDLVGNATAQRSFKLPNPMYYIA